MATTFPTNPTVGQVFVSGTKSFEWDGTAWRAKTSGVQTTGASLIPSGNEQQDLGSPTNRYKDLYLSANSLHLGDTVLTEASLGDLGGGATTVYATTSLLPRTGIDAGATAFVTETSRFYIWNGVGWFNVAVVNNTPTITNAPAATYNLFANGSPTIITLAATDVDGDTLTWSYSAPDASGKATITQADNVFTITPLTDIADTSFTIDFEVTDGINISTASSTVNIDNRSPVIDTAPSATYALATDGSPTIITLAATDPDGGSITWTYADSGLTDQATVVQNGNEFTITPNSTPAAYADFTLTFTASDSIESTSTSPTTLSLTFILLADEWSDTVLSIGTSSTNSLDNSTFIDRSTNAYTPTVTGTAIQTAFHPYLDNWSVEFDGAGDGLHFTGSGPADFGTGDFTLEMFVLVDTGEAGYSALYNSRNSPQGISAGFFFGLANGSRALMYYNGAARITDSTALEVERWYHVALVRNSGTTTLYKDGVSVGTYSDSFNYTSTEAEIGEDGGFAYDFDGKISNCRIIKGSALYTSNFTPPTEKLTAITNTTLLTCQSNRFIDNSSSSLTLEVLGTPKVSAFNPFGQGSEYEDGQNVGSMKVTRAASLPANGVYTNYSNSIGTSDFTFEVWVYLDAAPQNEDSLFSARYYYQPGENGNWVLRNVNGAFQWPVYNGTTHVGNYGFTFASGYTPASLVNRWSHLALVRNGDYIYLYVNGERNTNNISGFDNYNFACDYFSIAHNSYSRNASGYYSDAKLTLSAVYTGASFTPPTSPVGSTNAETYLPMDNAGIFDKTANNALTLFGNTSTSTTQTKYATTSMYFDGSGDYAKITSPSPTAGDLTLEFWMYPQNVVDQLPYIYDLRSSSVLNQPFAFIRNSNGMLEVFSSTPTKYEIGTITFDQWSHVAIVRESGTVTTYLNGIASASTFTDNTEWFTQSEFYLGSRRDQASDTFFSGYMENFQILKGVAKYTTNFTPPTQEQGRQYQQTS